MSIIVTGATGFIGKNLVARLAREGTKVKCLVRKSSNLDDLNFKNISFFFGDLTDKKSLDGLVKENDIVYHLASAVGSQTPETYYEVNVRGTKNLAEICKNVGIKKFVYFSSASAVGPSSEQIINEETPCNPFTNYGKTKREAEKLLLDLYEKEKFPIVILRAQIVYGPHDINETRDLSMIKLIKYVLNNKFFIIGKGEGCKRSICYVGNLVEGAILAAENPNTDGQIYFLGDEKTYSLLEIAKTISKIVNKKFREKHYPLFLANALAYINEKISELKREFPQFNRRVVRGMTSDWKCSIEKAKKEIGYTPKYDLEKALNETLEWYRSKRIIKW